MTILDKLNEYFGLIGNAIGNMFQWRVWKVVAALFSVYGLILFAEYYSMAGWLFSLVSTWNSFLTFLFGWAGLSDSAMIAFTHYPTHLALLGTYFGWSKLIVGVLFEGLIFGMAAKGFADVLHSSEGGEHIPTREVLARWPQLLLVWLFINTLLFAIGFFLPDLFSTFLDGPRRVMAFRFVVLPFAYLVVFAMFYFVFPLVALYRRNVFQAILDSLKLFSSRPFTCFSLSAAFMFAPILISSIIGYAPQLVSQFSPEIVLWLLSAGLIAEMFSMFFWMGTSVRFLADHYQR